MTIFDSAQSLFRSGKRRMRELSSSVVRHDRFDDGVLEDFQDRAKAFDRVLETPPLTPKVRMPKREDFGSEDDFNAAVAEAEARREEVERAAEGYAGWQHDVKDVFRAYHTWDEPSVLAQSEIKPSRELGRQVMQRLTLSDAFEDARPYTRHSDVEAGLATMTFADRLKTELETTLAEHVERSQEASDEETKIDQAEQALENLREEARKQKAETGAVSPDISQAIKEAIGQRQDGRGKLQKAAQAITALGTEAVADAVDAAAEEAEEAAEMLAEFPGNEPGKQSNITPEQAFALAQKFKENPTLRRITELVGKFKREMKYERAKRVTGGREEVVDFEPGADLALVLPHEMALLGHPVLRADWIRRFMERSLLQYEMVGEDHIGHGPAVVLVDGSGSMGQDLGGCTRNEWARALSLATLATMHDEHRDVVLIEYGTGADEIKQWFFPGRSQIDANDVAGFATHWFGGGTDITASLVRARDVMDAAPEFKQADVILMSDGQDHWKDDDDEISNSLRARGVRMQGISVGLGVTDYLTQACDVVTPVLALAAGGESIASVAQHLT